MPQPLRREYQPLQPEDSVKEFVWLLCNYDWTSEELRKCGIEERDFRRLVRLLRFQLVATGFVVV
jgi:hypothetical protein